MGAELCADGQDHDFVWDYRTRKVSGRKTDLPGLGKRFIPCGFTREVFGEVLAATVSQGLHELPPTCIHV